MDDRLHDLRREAEALLARIAAAEQATPGLLRPPADMHELAGHVVLEIDLPGVRPGEVQVYTQCGSIIVEGIKPAPELPRVPARLLAQLPPSSSRTPVSYQCLEREYGPFRRTFVLPSPCDLGQARAELAGGVLTIIVPILPEDRRRQRRLVPVTTRNGTRR
ncbi:MAG: Hsp20/alpha crystallin family protein [Myxococcales bacterium]|nr:Hsp20/alpha crystallin family protein [Myxococcota bacterium]MDW8281862.1 Hsp20/alpha crystallin family protein [Myxococcales bacterium]